MSCADAARAQQADISPARARKVRALSKRFDIRVRARVEALTLAHRYLEDYLTSFPAVLHALACDATIASVASAAEQLARAGAPLRAVAASLGLPMWLRQLPPEAFSGPIPKLPDTAEFALRIANVRPVAEKDARRWLAFVAAGFDACDEDFAVWAAKSTALFDADAAPDNLFGIALYAWFSARPELEAAQLMRKPFVAEAEPREAVANALEWIERLEFPLYDAPYIALDTECTSIGDFAFIPLRSAADLLEESEAMHNCLAGYASTTASGHDQIWSVCRHGDRLACIHIRFEAEARGVPMLQQIRGPYNQPVAADVLHAAYRWLMAWPANRDIKNAFRYGRIDHANYRRLMKPYWLAKGHRSWLPLADMGDHFNHVRTALWDLANPQRRQRGRRRG